MLTKAEALNKLNEIKRNSQHNGYMWASDVEDLFCKIYDEHEAQLKQAYIDGSNSCNELIQSLYKQIEQLKDKQ